MKIMILMPDATDRQRVLSIIKAAAPTAELLDAEYPTLLEQELMPTPDLIVAQPNAEIITVLASLKQKNPDIFLVFLGDEIQSPENLEADFLSKNDPELTHAIKFFKRFIARQEISKSHDVTHSNFHHQVKNNLAVIVSLLQMRARSLPTEDMQALLKDFAHRLRLLSQVQDLFYKAGSSVTLNILAIIEQVISLIRGIYPGIEILIVSETQQTYDFLSEKAVPIAFICYDLLNELKDQTPLLIRLNEDLKGYQITIKSKSDSNRKPFAEGVGEDMLSRLAGASGATLIRESPKQSILLFKR